MSTSNILSKAHIHLQCDDDEIAGGFSIRYESKQDLILLLHRIFSASEEVKEAFTEALLTFDTEEGGQTMNIQTISNAHP